MFIPWAWQYVINFFHRSDGDPVNLELVEVVEMVPDMTS